MKSGSCSKHVNCFFDLLFSQGLQLHDLPEGCYSANHGPAVGLMGSFSTQNSMSNQVCKWFRSKKCNIVEKGKEGKKDGGGVSGGHGSWWRRQGTKGWKGSQIKCHAMPRNSLASRRFSLRWGRERQFFMHTLSSSNTGRCQSNASGSRASVYSASTVQTSIQLLLFCSKLPYTTL